MRVLLLLFRDAKPLLPPRLARRSHFNDAESSDMISLIC